MANVEQEKLLRRDVKCWNNWRKDHLEIRPDLREAIFEDLDLTGINLSQVDLRDAVFRNCVLISANLESAKLKGATFSEINLAQEANCLYANMREAKITNCELQRICFNNADLSGTEIVECKFYDCEFLSTSLTGVNWSNCLLSK